MAVVTCPQCNKLAERGGYQTWQIVVAICKIIYLNGHNMPKWLSKIVSSFIASIFFGSLFKTNIIERSAV